MESADRPVLYVALTAATGYALARLAQRKPVSPWIAMAGGAGALVLWAVHEVTK